MAYTPPEYPSTIPGTDDLPDYVDDLDWVYAAHGNALRKELRAVMIELGVLPKGDAADVGARIAAVLPHFNDRGDPSGYDFAKAALITDGTWRDLDLSGIVPAGTKAVVIETYIQDDAVNSSIYYRKKGHTQDYNIAECSTQVANVHIRCQRITACNEDRIIQYNASNLVWTDINIIIKGWWK